MPTALLGRIRFTGAGLPVAEYLHREETLFVEPEWSWVALKEQAMVFPSYESAVAAAREHRWKDESGEHEPWAIVCGNPAGQAAREQREKDRIATALSSLPADDSVCPPTVPQCGPDATAHNAGVAAGSRKVAPTESDATSAGKLSHPQPAKKKADSRAEAGRRRARATAASSVRRGQVEGRVSHARLAGGVLCAARRKAPRLT